MSTCGKLTVKVVEAKLLIDVETAGITMDPYVEITHREDEFKTNVVKGGGKHPMFGDEFEINVKYIGDDLNIKIMNKNNIGASDLIASAVIKVSGFCVNGGLDEWWTVLHKGQDAGKIHFSSKWIPFSQETRDAGQDEGLKLPQKVAEQAQVDLKPQMSPAEKEAILAAQIAQQAFEMQKKADQDALVQKQILAQVNMGNQAFQDQQKDQFIQQQNPVNCHVCNAVLKKEWDCERVCTVCQSSTDKMLSCKTHDFDLCNNCVRDQVTKIPYCGTCHQRCIDEMPDHAMLCNECKGVTMAVWSCRPCDYDICFKCVSASVNA